jgi:parallel beta-helix repeat protein
VKRFISFLIAALLPLVVVLSSHAVIYYVDCNANGDAGAGTSTAADVAWKTIAKVNASSFSAGDSILFNKGCTWREQLTVPSSGSAGSPITFGAYGTGAAPTLNLSAARTLSADYGSTGDLITDNFDDGNTTGWTKAGGGTLTVSTEQQHTGGYSVKSTTAWTTLYKAITASPQIWFRAYIYPTAWPTEGNTEIIAIRVGSSAKIYITISTAGVVGYWNIPGSAGGNGSKSLVLNQWNLLEGTAKVSDTVGEVHIKVNGLAALDVTGANTGTSNWDRFDFGLLTYAATLYYDDVDVSSTAYIGPTLSNTYSVTMADDPNAVSVNGVLAEEKATLAALAAGSWFYDGTATKLYYMTDGTAIGNYTIETNANSNGIYATQKDYFTLDGLKLLGPSTYDGIYINRGGTGINIQNMSFANFHGPGIEITSNSGDNLSVTISGNTFADAGRQFDIYLHPHATGTASATISNNTMAMSSYKGDATLPDSSQRKAIETDNIDTMTISGNTITFPNVTGDTSTILSSGCGTQTISGNSITGGNHGITVYNATSGGTVTKNIVQNSYDDNYWVYGTSDGVVVSYNIGINSHDDCIDTEGINTKIYNNVCIGAVDTGLWVHTSATGVVAKNNIFYQNGAVGTPTTGDETGYEIRVAASCTGFVSDNNTFYHTTAKNTTTPFFWGGSDSPPHSDGTAYNFADWKTNSSQDAHSLNADPLFLSTSNFHLKGSSPARRAGVSVGLTTDFAGRPVLNPPCIGAYEYGGGRKPMRLGGKWR